MRDAVTIRDFTEYVPKEQKSEIGWQLRDYRLLDLTRGTMLWVNGKVGDIHDYSDEKLPCVLEIDPGLTGLYTITLGIPLTGDRPFIQNHNGVDIALDGEDFVHLYYQYGVRYGKVLCEFPKEGFVRYKTADMTGRKVRIRVPYGTFLSNPAGAVRACLSALIFTPAEETERPSGGKKTVGVVCDGFSHYWSYAKPGENLDLRLPEIYADTDVRMLFHQITNASLWKSDITYYFGENLTKEDMVGKRSGDVRLCEYLDWAVHSGRNFLKEQAEACHRNGIQSHFSIRANLYSGDGNGVYQSGPAKFSNGTFWFEHPECRQPDSPQLDYDKPAVQDHYLALFREAFTVADFDGINLDLTRWPPVFRKGLNSTRTLPVFLTRMRELADELAAEKGHPVAVSLLAVEGFHSYMSLEDQLIDLEAVLDSGTLDFICLETAHIEKYTALAHAHGTPIYAIFDGDGAFAEGGSRKDPLWIAPKYSNGEEDDPKAGEEFRDEPYIRSVPAPWEMAMLADRDYARGADGIVCVNHFMEERTLSDLGDPETVRRHAEERSAYGQTEGDYLFVL